MPLLYHGTANPDLQQLVPSEDKGDDNPEKLVFATDNEADAYLYAIQESNNPQKPRIIMDTGNQYPSMLITPYQSQYFGNAMNGRVFTIPDDTFVPSGKTDNEWVSKEVIPLNQDIAVKINNADQALEKGVQLFLVKGGLEAWPAVFNRIKDIKGRNEILAFIKEHVDAGNMTHENRERNLKPMDLNTGRLEAGKETMPEVHEEKVSSPIAGDAVIKQRSEQALEKKDIVKAALTGAGIGAALFPALGLVFDALSKHKSFTSGRRLKFLASEASLGAVVNGTLNAALAWGQNKIASRKHTERIDAGKQDVNGNNPTGNSLS